VYRNRVSIAVESSSNLKAGAVGAKGETAGAAEQIEDDW
jgi:hypothetical protein